MVLVWLACCGIASKINVKEPKKRNATYARSLRHGIALKRQLLETGRRRALSGSSHCALLVSRNANIRSLRVRRILGAEGQNGCVLLAALSLQERPHDTTHAFSARVEAENACKRTCRFFPADGKWPLQHACM